jgi:hypothetical protein
MAMSNNKEKGIIIPNQRHFSFKIPSIVTCVGGTGVGKSVLIGNILRYRAELIEPTPKHIIYVYNIFQNDLFNQIKDWCNGDITFVSGLSELQKIKLQPDTCLILDDVQQQMSDSKDFAVQLMTVGMHHQKLIIFYICQSLFLKSKHNTMIHRQSSVVIMFRNKRNMYEAETLLRQTMQLKPTEVRWLYKDISRYNSRPYLCIDCSPDTPEYRQLTSNILPIDTPKIFYMVVDE